MKMTTKNMLQMPISNLLKEFADSQECVPTLKSQTYVTKIVQN